MVVFIKKKKKKPQKNNQIKNDFPHNVAPCTERADGIAKPAQLRHIHWKIVCMT